MIANKNSELPFVSVVICTYNRKNFLKSCLESVYAQDFPLSNFEVIVIDGGSTDGSEKICENFPQLRFVVERKHGLAYARNKGADLARGAIVVYTDDDCIVGKQWLRSLVQEFSFSRKVGAVGGPVYPLQPEIIPKKILVHAAFGLFDAGNKPKLVDGIITSNSAFKKDLFNTIKFDEKLGVTRRTKLILSSEDTDFCQQILNSGLKIRYTPLAKVYHHIHRNRIRVPYIVKHALDSGITQTRIAFKAKKSRVWVIRYALGQLMQSILRIPRNRTFVSCYNLLYYSSTLFLSITRLDVILLRD